MRTRSYNPFLPKPTSVRWRKGPFARKESSTRFNGETDLPAFQGRPAGDVPAHHQKLQNAGALPRERISQAPTRTHPDAGKLSFCPSSFFEESNSAWGTNIDMIGLVHGPVGCGAFTQTSRLNLPGLVQGAESFTALHISTDLNDSDLEDGGNAKLTNALNELQTLFPLAQGITVLNQDAVSLLDGNAKSIAAIKAKELDKPIVALSCEYIKVKSTAWVVETAATLRKFAKFKTTSKISQYDVAVPFSREATGLLWIVSKLFQDIGLNLVHEFSGSSTSDMARIPQCTLVIGIAESSNVPTDYCPGNAGQLLQHWFGTPFIWTCFASPSATDASLRTIATFFDGKIQSRVEQVIAINRKKTDDVIAKFRPKLEGKLVLHFHPMTNEQLEPYRLLGMRIGSSSGWIGKTGKWRTPRLVCDLDHPSEKAIDSYIAEAKPDLVLHFGGSEGRGEYDWRKRGQNALPFTQLFDRKGNAYWSYDGFACFAAALDRRLNTPWRKLLNPPWPIDSG